MQWPLFYTGNRTIYHQTPNSPKIMANKWYYRFKVYLHREFWYPFGTLRLFLRVGMHHMQKLYTVSFFGSHSHTLFPIRTTGGVSCFHDRKLVHNGKSSELFLALVIAFFIICIYHSLQIIVWKWSTAAAGKCVNALETPNVHIATIQYAQSTETSSSDTDTDDRPGKLCLQSWSRVK